MGALGAFLDFELDRLAFFQRAIAVAGDLLVVDENVLAAAIVLDETEALRFRTILRDSADLLLQYCAPRWNDYATSRMGPGRREQNMYASRNCK